MKDFFENNSPTQLEATHQTTRFSADQTIQFATAVGLEVSLASSGMLEDLLLKANLIGRGGGGARGGGKTSSKSMYSSRAGTSVGDRVASHSVYFLQEHDQQLGRRSLLGKDQYGVQVTASQIEGTNDKVYQRFSFNLCAGQLLPRHVLSA